MKRVICAALAAMCVLGCGCGKDNSKDKSEGKKAENAASFDIPKEKLEPGNYAAAWTEALEKQDFITESVSYSFIAIYMNYRVDVIPGDTEEEQNSFSDVRVTRTYHCKGEEFSINETSEKNTRFDSMDISFDDFSANWEEDPQGAVDWYNVCGKLYRFMPNGYLDEPPMTCRYYDNENNDMFFGSPVEANSGIEGLDCIEAVVTEEGQVLEVYETGSGGRLEMYFDKETGHLLKVNSYSDKGGLSGRTYYNNAVFGTPSVELPSLDGWTMEYGGGNG
ncbi:MAG: hypothetical protein IJ737_07085 [Ruminococcus sp.]|nr:hypothetical protein [Ruminococcus sp.]